MDNKDYTTKLSNNTGRVENGDAANNHVSMTINGERFSFPFPPYPAEYDNYTSSYGDAYGNVIPDTTPNETKALWEQRRYEIAKAVIGGWAASIEGFPQHNLESNVGYAIEIADELIRQLRD